MTTTHMKNISEGELIIKSFNTVPACLEEGKKNIEFHIHDDHLPRWFQVNVMEGFLKR